MNINPYLSVIIPVYNETQRLSHLLEVIEYLKSLPFKSELIMVNDGSTDKTPDVLQKLQQKYNFKLISYSPNKGKGYAIKQGMLNSSGRYCCFTDIDLSTPLANMKNFLPIIDQYDLLIGTRKNVEANLLIHQSFIRESLGKCFTALSSFILQVPVSDFTCGFKFFSNSAIKTIAPRLKINRWGFDSEILFIATRHKLSIHEIPVSWMNDPMTKVKMPRDLIRSFSELITIRWNYLRGYYN